MSGPARSAKSGYSEERLSRQPLPAGVWKRGYVQLPQMFVSRCALLGITCGEAWFIVQLMSFWGNDTPFPSLGTLAQRMGISRCQARRYCAHLRAKGFLDVIPRYTETGWRVSDQYDLSPLWQALNTEHPDKQG